MRLVILDTTVHGSLIGGGHLYLPPLLSGLLAKGNDVHLVTAGRPNDRIYYQLINSGVALHTAVWDSDQYVEKAVIQFADWVNELKPDVFVISASADIGWVVLPYLNGDIATVTIGHTDDETFYMPARHYHSFLTRAVGVSNEICKNYVQNCLMLQGQVAWVPYGVEGREEPPVTDDHSVIKILYAGRIAREQKRVFDLVQIANQLKDQQIKFELRIIGDGPDMEEFRTSLNEEILSGKVIMMGWLDKSEVQKFMQSSEIFLLTSEYEGFCIALVEAMANGCCPVVSNIESGNTELVHHEKNGYLVAVGNIEQYVGFLSTLSSNKELLQHFRLQSWEMGKKYSTQAMVENYDTLFKSAKEDVDKNKRVPDPSYPVMPSCRSKYPFWLRDLKIYMKKSLNK